VKRILRAMGACAPTARYLMETEVHVYAFSIAANVLLSLFPFLLVMVSICKYILQWPAAVDAIGFAVRDALPGEVGEFVARNTSTPRRMEFLSLILLLFTTNGIFEPLEIALNRAWGVTKNRSFVRNQMISMGLIFVCGGLALLSIVLTAFHPDLVPELARTVVYKAAAVPVSILCLFLVYWLLPNRRIPWREMIAPAILVGVALELFKYMNRLLAPWLETKLTREYGKFIQSVSIILWSFFASMIVLAGAEWTARNERLRTGERVTPLTPAGGKL
jgi:YihY family inner membrane protein